jgi:hypothetical protein
VFQTGVGGALSTPQAQHQSHRAGGKHHVPARSCAEQRHAGDGLQLTLRFSFQPRLMPGGVPCMLSCSGVKVPCPGMRGAEGQGKRKGVTARWGLKEAWNAGAGRGTRTGYEVWHSRDERARDREVLHPQLGCALYIRRLCTDGMTAYHGRSAGCPGKD